MRLERKLTATMEIEFAERYWGMYAVIERIVFGMLSNPRKECLAQMSFELLDSML
jgi:hypothetical protein